MVDGLRNLDDGYIPPIFLDNHGAELLDGKRIVRPRESIEWTRRLTEVGIFAGLSSGAILAGAVKTAATLESGVIVTVCCDAGWKYLSTGAWTDDLDVVEARAKADHLLLTGSSADRHDGVACCDDPHGEEERYRRTGPRRRGHPHRPRL